MNKSTPNKIQNFKELIVWKKSMTLANVVYTGTREFPKEERYGLTSQIQRCAVSIPSNIAEGNARIHMGDYIRHLSIARGSLAELETQLLLARDFEYLNSDL